MDKSNKVIDITGDILHTLAIEFNTSIREINTIVGNRVYEIVSDIRKEQEKNKDFIF